MQKLSFALEVEDGWPPVAVEHVWCERNGQEYELKNAPFFIQGLAFGDKFTAESCSNSGCVFEFTVVEASGHSLVWVLDTGELKFKEHKAGLLELGCSIECCPSIGLHAVDVPPSIEAEAASESIDRLECLGFPLAFPVWRHERHAA